jgi:putative pyruvate formate lyase activating enzyme
MEKNNHFKELELLKDCNLCPRECGSNRFNSPNGYCKTGAGYPISSIVLHKGEEPVISGNNGICNVFFSHCNLQCIYCQNYQISFNSCNEISRDWSLEEVLETIISFLDDGIENVGFVSPSHVVQQVKIIINELHERGYYPIIVYNTNAYEKVETLQSLETLVDVYLPDLKYMDEELAGKWSGASNYPEVAGNAIKEMFRQKGNGFVTGENGKLLFGMVVRHLVLPGSVENSLKVLRFLAEEVSNRIAVSLMSQYHPIQQVLDIFPLNGEITGDEYQLVVEEMENLGFSLGWKQEPESTSYYNPDFSDTIPFRE